MKVALCGPERRSLEQVGRIFGEYLEENTQDSRVDLYDDWHAMLPKAKEYRIICVALEEWEESVLPLQKVTGIDNIKKTRGDITLSLSWTLPIEREDIAQVFYIYGEHQSANQKSRVIDFAIQGRGDGLPVADILYFETKDRKMYVQTKTERIQLSLPMKKIKELTASGMFAMPFISYWVNLKEVAKIQKRDIVLKNGEHIPLSQKQAPGFRRQFLWFHDIF